MLGGVDANNGIGGVVQVTVSGSWAADDTFSLTFTTPSNGVAATLGAGPITNQNPTRLLTYKKKLYLLGGGQVMWFSAINLPNVINDPNAAGNGFMDLSNEYGFSDDLNGAAIFQGYVAAFARRSIQIVAVDADALNYQVVQTLENIGTVNGDSVRGIGDRDVLFCADSGFRSLQVLNTNNKITPYDVGTPIDALVVARLLAVGVTQMASIVEPGSNRYWCAIGNQVYVLSHFPDAGVTAWSIYTPSTETLTTVIPTVASAPAYEYTVTIGAVYYWAKGSGETTLTCGDTVLSASGYFVAKATTVTVGHPLIGPGLDAGVLSAASQTTFTPEKFEEREGRVYVRDTDGKIYLYGGSDNATYDSTVCSWETPWLDAKQAANKKLGNAIDAGMEGGWALSFGMDYVSAILKEVYRNTTSSFAKGVIPSTMKGTHFKVRGATYGVGYARFSMFAFHFDEG